MVSWGAEIPQCWTVCGYVSGDSTARDSGNRNWGSWEGFMSRQCLSWPWGWGQTRKEQRAQAQVCRNKVRVPVRDSLERGFPLQSEEGYQEPMLWARWTWTCRASITRQLFSLGGIWKASSLGREGPALGFCSSCPVTWWLWAVWSAHAFLCFSVFLPNTLFPAVPSFPDWSKLLCIRAVGCLYRVKSLRQTWIQIPSSY